jgi:hypothetical protein
MSPGVLPRRGCLLGLQFVAVFRFPFLPARCDTSRSFLTFHALVGEAIALPTHFLTEETIERNDEAS